MCKAFFLFISFIKQKKIKSNIKIPIKQAWLILNTGLQQVPALQDKIRPALRHIKNKITSQKDKP